MYESAWAERAVACCSAGANAQHKDAKMALLMWMHVMEGTEMTGPPQDLVHYLRALAHEVTSTPGNAYHFYIMLQVPCKPCACRFSGLL